MSKMLRSLFYSISTLCVRIRFLAFSPSPTVSVRNAKFGLPFHSRIDKDNSVHFQDVTVRKCTFSIRGEGNVAELRGHLYNTRISIFGTGNKLIIEDGASILNSNLMIRATNGILHIGKGTSVGSVRIVCMGNECPIEIGAECMFSENVEIWNSDGHDIWDKESGKMLNPSSPVTVGDKVWLGKNVTILKGVTVGDGAIVGYGSIVTKDVPAESVVAGDGSKVLARGMDWSKNWTKN